MIFENNMISSVEYNGEDDLSDWGTNSEDKTMGNNKVLGIKIGASDENLNNIQIKLEMTNIISEGWKLQRSSKDLNK